MKSIVEFLMLITGWMIEMFMNNKNKKWIERTLNDIPFVKWDRFLDLKFGRNRIIHTFGWINREDNYKDFVCLEFDIIKQEVLFISTSSKKYSKKISDILGSKHTDCERIENSFNINNCVIINQSHNNKQNKPSEVSADSSQT